MGVGALPATLLHHLIYFSLLFSYKLSQNAISSFLSSQISIKYIKNLLYGINFLYICNIFITYDKFIYNERKLYHTSKIYR